MIALFEDILIVDGYSRSLIIDFTRKKSLFIPRLWSRIIKKYNKKRNYDEIEDAINRKPLLSSLMNFLHKNELIWDMEIELIDKFPCLEFVYEKPQFIDMIVVFISETNLYDVKLFFKKEPYAYIRTVQLICYENKAADLIDLIINIPYPTRIFLHYNKEFFDIDNFYNKIPKKYLDNIVLSELNNCRSTNYRDLVLKNKTGDAFVSNFYQVCSAFNNNSFLNRTLFVSPNSYVYPNYDFNSNAKYALVEINDGKVKIEHLLNNNDFIELWKLSKNDIEVCKDCEFRFICIDCRIPEKMNKHWRYRDFCTYNPYICRWQEEEEYISTLSCGHYSESGKFIPNKTFIRDYNHRIWDDL